MPPSNILQGRGVEPGASFHGRNKFFFNILKISAKSKNQLNTSLKSARSMRKKYEEELNQDLREKRTPATTITSKQRGSPLILGDLDGMVQNYLRVRIFVLLC